MAIAQKCHGTQSVLLGAESHAPGSLDYLELAPRHIRQALRRAFDEIDALPPQPSPEVVCGSRLRRRLLELRLIIDFYALAYDHDLLKVYRDIISKAYERVGRYQDVQVARRLLGEDLDADGLDERRLRMSVALAPLRSADVRDALDEFTSSPGGWLDPHESRHVPRLWSLAASRPGDGLDAAGNLALLAHNVLRRIRATGILVDDIFDPEQQERFHETRKMVRAVLTLTDMFPATLYGIADLRGTLVRLVTSYGAVRDCVIAHETAKRLDRHVEERAESLAQAFSRACAEVQDLLEDGSFDLLIERLEAIEREHCQAVPMAVAA
jgi:hypothetical protein